MPLTIFFIKGVSGNRRESIEAAVVAGGKHARRPYEGWIAVDARRVARVLMTGPDSQHVVENADCRRCRVPGTDRQRGPLAARRSWLQQTD
jgi:hypothetical protein